MLLQWLRFAFVQPVGQIESSVHAIYSAANLCMELASGVCFHSSKFPQFKH